MLTIASGIRDDRDRENIKMTRLDMITICDRDRIIVLVQRLLLQHTMCDVISFATPLDGFRERGFDEVTHGPIGFWCSQKLLRHTSFLLSATV